MWIALELANNNKLKILEKDNRNAKLEQSNSIQETFLKKLEHSKVDVNIVNLNNEIKQLKLDNAVLVEKVDESDNCMFTKRF